MISLTTRLTIFCYLGMRSFKKTLNLSRSSFTYFLCPKKKREVYQIPNSTLLQTTGSRQLEEAVRRTRHVPCRSCEEKNLVQPNDQSRYRCHRCLFSCAITGSHELQRSNIECERAKYCRRKEVRKEKSCINRRSSLPARGPRPNDYAEEPCTFMQYKKGRILVMHFPFNHAHTKPEQNPSRFAYACSHIHLE